MQDIYFNTLEQALYWAEKAFQQAKLYYGHGTNNAWDEAVYLALPTLNLPIDADRSVLQQTLTTEQSVKLLGLFKRRINEHIPAAYLINKAWFAGLEFYVDERVLVPRSPLAEVIQAKFLPWIANNQIQCVLELGTGSACIALAIAHYIPKVAIDAVDINSDALQVAQMNLRKYAKQDQINLIQSDLFEQLPEQHYDIIIANPPYVDALDMATLPAEYRHEPKLGLAAGKDGLAIVSRILEQAHDFLNDQGILIVEVGNNVSALQQCYPQLPFLWLAFEQGGDGVFLLTKEQLQ